MSFFPGLNPDEYGRLRQGRYERDDIFGRNRAVREDTERRLAAKRQNRRDWLDNLRSNGVDDPSHPGAYRWGEPSGFLDFPGFEWVPLYAGEPDDVRQARMAIAQKERRDITSPTPKYVYPDRPFKKSSLLDGFSYYEGEPREARARRISRAVSDNADANQARRDAINAVEDDKLRYERERDKYRSLVNLALDPNDQSSSYLQGVDFNRMLAEQVRSGDLSPDAYYSLMKEFYDSHPKQKSLDDKRFGMFPIEIGGQMFTSMSPDFRTVVADDGKLVPRAHDRTTEHDAHLRNLAASLVPEYYNSKEGGWFDTSLLGRLFGGNTAKYVPATPYYDDKLGRVVFRPWLNPTDVRDTANGGHNVEFKTPQSDYERLLGPTFGSVAAGAAGFVPWVVSPYVGIGTEGMRMLDDIQRGGTADAASRAAVLGMYETVGRAAGKAAARAVGGKFGGLLGNTAAYAAPYGLSGPVSDAIRDRLPSAGYFGSNLDAEMFPGYGRHEYPAYDSETHEGGAPANLISTNAPSAMFTTSLDPYDLRSTLARYRKLFPRIWDERYVGTPLEQYGYTPEGWEKETRRRLMDDTLSLGLGPLKVEGHDDSYRPLSKDTGTAAGMGKEGSCRDMRGLLKVAGLPPFTVGDYMRLWNADLNANQSARRSAFDKINGSGLNVKDPASRIPYVLGGAVGGRQLAKYFGAGSFGKFVGTAAGAVAGNMVYNGAHPSFNPLAQDLGNGIQRRGW